jgi:protein-S-isoprenylcysteine O-methyltransferase Ste14
MVVAGTALGRGLTAAPLSNSHAELRTRGLYRFVRHPIYSGLLLLAVAVAVALASGSRWTTAACAALVVLINAKARWEERHLAARAARFVPVLAR